MFWIDYTVHSGLNCFTDEAIGLVKLWAGAKMVTEQAD